MSENNEKVSGRRLTKEEMIERNLIPPSKKDADAEHKLREETLSAKEKVSEYEEARREYNAKETIARKHTEESPEFPETTEDLLSRYSSRAQLATTFVHTLISQDEFSIANYPASKVVQYAFALADGIQDNTNEEYIKASVEQQMEKLRVRANKE